MDDLNVVPTNCRLIAFDWDGTLLDSSEATLRAYQTILKEAGIEIPDFELLNHYSPNWHSTYRALGINEELFAWADRRWLEAYSLYPHHSMPGALEVLRELKARGYILILLTAASRKRLTNELKEFDLEQFFLRVISMEDFKCKKPDPLPLSFTLKELEVAPWQAAYVGDTAEDIEMGQKAGVITIAIPGPYISTKILAQANPTYLASSLEELLAIFPSLSSNL